MAINVSNVFKIHDIPTVSGCQWSVTWEGYGKIRALPNQAKIFEAASHSSTNRFGIALDNGTVHWIDPIVLLQGNLSIEEVINYLHLAAPIVGVAFVGKTEAEKFIELMEQKIIMLALTRND